MDISRSFRPDRPVDHVAIIGAGFSGALQAINLLRHDGPRATLIERRDHIGRGVAYSAAHPDHLLNVRAGNMSALPDEPDHFLRWLATERPGQSTGFVPRITYGDYLADLLAETRASAGDRLTVRRGEVTGIETNGDGVRIDIAGAPAITADAAILAIGNLPPHDPHGMENLGDDVYVGDPWRADLAEGLTDADEVLIIGSGLTMVDVALLLEASGFRGRITAQSRRGLLPHVHAVDGAPPIVPAERPSLSPATLLRDVRAAADESGWRPVIDGLRSHTQDMWRGASHANRARFLRHLRPYWDVHRHRLAPPVAACIAAMRESGRLRIVAGRTIAHEREGDGAAIVWRPRGSDVPERRHVRRIINCSGPQGNLLRTPAPLLQQLVAQGLIRPDPLTIGIDVNPQSHVIGRDGQANARLLAVGPMTRGAFWEIVAVPDIRVQTWAVARRLSNAHWVEGEGL